jgi:hypothetical protein
MDPAPRTCLRCDWHGTDRSDACPRCGQRPLYLVPSRPAPTSGRTPRATSRVSNVVEDGGAVTAEVVADPAEPSRFRSSVTVVVLAALVAVLAVGTWRRPAEEPRPPVDGAARFIPPRPAQPDSIPVRGYAARRRTLSVDGVRLSYEVPTHGWESSGRTSISMAGRGSHDGSAVVVWTGLSADGSATPCAGVLDLPASPTANDFVEAVVHAPGVRLTGDVSNNAIDGRPTTSLSLRVRRDIGCEPGFFFSWRDGGQGSLWPGTRVGDAITLWIVDVGGGRHMVIEAETSTNAGPELALEVQQIVRSTRFA